MPYLGAEGYVCVVPKAGANGDTVFALLAELCSRETSQQLVLDPQFGGGAVRRDQLAGDGGWQGFGLGKQQTPDLVKALRESLTHAAVTNPVLRLRTPRQRDYQAVMVRELRAALEQDKDALSALTAVAQAWERLDAQLPPGEARAQYRMSLGLDPG
jgi:hypothetical protein